MQRRAQAAGRALEEQQFRALVTRAPAHFVKNARLADPGLALDHHHAAVSCNGAVPCFSDRGEFGLAIDERTAQPPEGEEAVDLALVTQREPDQLRLGKPLDRM